MADYESYVSHCWNPTEQVAHNLKGFGCDGHNHMFSPVADFVGKAPNGSINFNENAEPPSKPWHNDGDKISGMGATIVLLGVALVIFAVLARLAVWVWP